MALYTPEGTAIAGFGFEESACEIHLDKLYTPARWKTKQDVSELVGRNVVIHFEIRGAALYGYRFVS